MIVLSLLPAILWVIALIAAAWVIVVCIQRSRYDADGIVRPVAWSVVGGHLCSLVLGMLPYAVELLIGTQIDRRVRDWYHAIGWWSAALMTALIAVEIFLMYRQARRAMFSQMAADAASIASNAVSNAASNHATDGVHDGVHGGVYDGVIDAAPDDARAGVPDDVPHDVSDAAMPGDAHGNT